MGRVSLFCGVAASLLLTFACGGSSTGPAFLSLGSAPPGGAFFVVGGALSEVLNDHGGGAWTVSAEATSGSQENIRRLASGEIDFAVSNSSITYFAVRGTEGWERPYPVRTIMTLAPNVVMCVTPASSGVTRMADLRGRRVYVGPAGAGFEFFVKPILEGHGLTWNDITPINGTQAAAVDMLADGSVAVAILGGAVPTASITQAAATQDIRLVPYDEAAKQRLIEQYLFFDAATVPADTYRGQTADFAGLDVGSMHLITSADQDEALVYEIAKTIYEHREDVVAKHAAGRAINPRNVVRNTGTEFHPGAIRYYREIGIWPN